jgi:hypothetical protein
MRSSGPNNKASRAEPALTPVPMGPGSAEQREDTLHRVRDTQRLITKSREPRMLRNAPHLRRGALLSRAHAAREVLMLDAKPPHGEEARSTVSNHECSGLTLPPACLWHILRDAAKWPLLRMRSSEFLRPHGEEPRSGVSNHECSGLTLPPACLWPSFETRPSGRSSG